MKNNQGGSVIIYILIIIAVVSAVAALSLTVLKASRPSQMSEANSASIRDMGLHLDQIEQWKVRFQQDIRNSITDNQKLKGQLDDLEDVVAANKLEIDRLSGAKTKLSDRIERLEAVVAGLSERVQNMPREMSIRMQAIKDSIPVEIRNAKFVSKSWMDYERREVTGRNGKRIQKMVPVRKQLMKSVEPRAKKSRFQMPGVKAAKDQIVEAGL